MSLNSSEAAWWLLCLGAACSLQIPDQAWTPGLLPPENIKSLVFEILSFLLLKNHKNKRTQPNRPGSGEVGLQTGSANSQPAFGKATSPFLHSLLHEVGVRIPRRRGIVRTCGMTLPVNCFLSIEPIFTALNCILWSLTPVRLHESQLTALGEQQPFCCISNQRAVAGSYL